MNTTGTLSRRIYGILLKMQWSYPMQLSKYLEVEISILARPLIERVVPLDNIIFSRSQWNHECPGQGDAHLLVQYQVLKCPYFNRCYFIPFLSRILRLNGLPSHAEELWRSKTRDKYSRKANREERPIHSTSVKCPENKHERPKTTTTRSVWRRRVCSNMLSQETVVAVDHCWGLHGNYGV